MISGFIAAIGLTNLLAGPAIGLVFSAIRIFSAGRQAVQVGAVVAKAVGAATEKTVSSTAVAPRDTPVELPKAVAKPAPVVVVAPTQAA